MESKVSIVSPCFNGEKYLAEFFDSIINQTYKNIELILVDDGSTDNTQKICEEYENKFKKANIPFKYIYQSNQGQAAACENGFQYVTGKYLYWPDSDDWIEKNSIETLVSFLINNSDYKAARGYVVMYDEETGEIINTKKPADFNKELLFDDYLFVTKNVYCFTGVILIDFDYFKEINGGINIYKSPGGQNWQIILPVVFEGKCKYIDQHIYNYRVSKNSHSHSDLTASDRLNRLKTHKDILIYMIDKLVKNLEIKNLYIKKLNKKYNSEIFKLSIRKSMSKFKFWKKREKL